MPLGTGVLPWLGAGSLGWTGWDAEEEALPFYAREQWGFMKLCPWPDDEVVDDECMGRTWAR